MTVTWGITLPLPELPLRGHRALVAGLSELGWTDVWTGEGGGADAFTPLAAAGAWAPELRLGTGIVPVQTRGPAVLAQTAATLAELTGSQVLLGIGSSVPAHVTAINGLAHGRPYAHVRDMLRFLSRVLAGEMVRERYETLEVDGFGLARVPVVRPKVVVGALRPGMLRLAFSEGDGAITNVLSAADVPRIVAAVGPQPVGKELVVKVFVCPTDDARYARARGREFLGWILNQPPYRAFHDWLGRGPDLAAAHRRWDEGDRRGAGAALPDHVVDALWVHGSPEECRARLSTFVRPGVTGLLVYLAPTPETTRDPAALTAVLRALSPGA
ncbi:LLM class F420-dependent oxidoreductase [Embleya sp. NBC_00888]|uniref:LLM class F420-dependent oxidoreductase n=1 Tax=Embleya sp. NBC_00888 TaxID=2975960 RepID=UPI00386729D1|nr:LLM class F420-dependent oxidoreductase [Embleya sp. NBC_00888]